MAKKKPNQLPTLDERVTLYLRAVYEDRDFTDEERANAREALLCCGSHIKERVPVPMGVHSPL
jgi:hypothetical protein